jgi:hypothetical protein
VSRSGGALVTGSQASDRSELGPPERSARVWAMKITPAVLLLSLLGAASATAATRQPGAAAQSATFRTVVPFLHDDYARAVAEARARKVPLFVEAWAPW